MAVQDRPDTNSGSHTLRTHISTYLLAQTFDVVVDTGTQVSRIYKDLFPFKGDLDRVTITLTDLQTSV
jgi:hypothetical protein